MKPDVVLVVDYGAQYAQLIARRIREAHVYSEIVPHTASVADMLAREPKAIVLSGGPASVYVEDAPQADPALFEADVPVLGICYGFQAMVQALGGEVAATGGSEFGRTTLRVLDPGVLLRGLPAEQQVWMSHGDEVTRAPDGFVVTGSSAGAPVASFENVARRLAGVQFHPEVLHTAARPTNPAALPVRHRGSPPPVDRGQHHRRAGVANPGPGRRQAGDLWAVRWCRLRGGRGVGAASGR